MDTMGRGNRLGEYLQARRALVTPQRAGIPAGGRRRVSGLRREEVAMLAGISADYYLRLERGRDDNPSPQVLAALAGVLELDDVETDYLLGMTSPSPRSRRRPRHTERVPARLHHLLAALEVPAFVEGRHFDVLASNTLATALSPRLAPGHNRLRSLLLDPAEREFHRDWEHVVAGFIAAFRGSTDGQDPTDVRTVELVGELSVASTRFRTLWARHDVARLEGGTVDLEHPEVGALRLHREKLPVDGLVLVLYYPETGGDSAEKLRLLATIATTASRPPLAPQPSAAADPHL